MIGLFTIDMGVINFKYYHLNESWFGFHMYYFGINLERMLLFHPSTVFLCGVITIGYFDPQPSTKRA